MLCARIFLSVAGGGGGGGGDEGGGKMNCRRRLREDRVGKRRP